MTVIGALSSFREPGEMSPHKRAYVYRHSFTWTKNRLPAEVIRVRSSHSEDRKLEILSIRHVNRI